MAQNPYASRHAVASDIALGDVLLMPAKEFNFERKTSPNGYGYVVSIQYETVNEKETNTVLGFSVLEVIPNTDDAKGGLHVFVDTFSSGLPTDNVTSYMLSDNPGFHPVNEDTYFAHRLGSYRNTGEHDRIMDSLAARTEQGLFSPTGYASSNRLWTEGGISFGGNQSQSREFDPDKGPRKRKAGVRSSKRFGTMGATEGGSMDYALEDAQTDLGLNAEIAQTLIKAGITTLRGAIEADEKKLSKVFPLQANPRSLDDVVAPWISRAFKKAAGKNTKITTLEEAAQAAKNVATFAETYFGGQEILAKQAADAIKAANKINKTANATTPNPEALQSLNAAWKRLRTEFGADNETVKNKIIFTAGPTLKK